MKNIHVLKSDKPSRLHLGGSGLVLCDFVFDKSTINGQHIYITDDKEIKPNEWYENNGVIFKADTVFDEGNNPNNSNPRVTGFNKKIILTTDQDLIKDGVQSIDDEFLEWVVKNPSCEEVEFSIMNKGYNKKEDIPYQEFYKIIIPKEEPKCTCKEHDPYCCQIHGSCPTCVKKEEPKQETLEEAYQRGYKRGLNALIPLIENLQSEISKLKRNL
jgi:hypothetical protein